ncbi:hypothetical protein [Burkholderia sp. 22313]|uniref:hypothetical protein n=1 Tax=Burkholderia sp. 22313 TaxID=3453908 RepID=UPI003F84CCB4
MDRAAFDIFRRITQDITNTSRIKSIIDQLLKIKKTGLFRRTPTLIQPRFIGVPRTFPHQAFPNPVDI